MPAQDRVLNRRQRQLWELHDFSEGTGLEIGPLHNLSVHREYADVRYLDVFDRDTLLRNYEDHANVDPELIPSLDYWLFDGDRVRSIPETIGPDTRFDWVMAAHVAEHVPDLIGWLAQIAEVTVDGGRLVLVVPDRRHCFDVHRPGTTTGQLLQAHELGETAPSVRAVYDYKRGHAGTKAVDTWQGRAPTYAYRLYSLEQVLEQVDRARKGEYVDSHVWTFTPGSFLEQVIELRRIGLSEWAVEKHVPTRRNTNEFFVVLRRLPRSGDWPAELFAGEPTDIEMPDWLQQQVALRERVEELKGKLRASRERNEALRTRIEEMQGSWRWRVGSALVRPAAGTRRLLARRSRSSRRSPDGPR
jgi:SAM-dependent methyltransferase